MDIKSILIESRYKNADSVLGISGIMFNNRYVITTFSAIAEFFTNLELEKLESEKTGLHILVAKKFEDVLISIYSKDEESNRILSYRAYFENLFQSNNIKESNKWIFRNWSFEFGNKPNVDLFLSWFVVLKIDGADSNLAEDMKSWFNQMSKASFSKGQNLKCINSAFGNQHFMNHYSEGIISNILGRSGCLIFSDMPLTPGSEGSPVFADNRNSSEVPIGIVISTLNWWKGESLNFTVIADLRSLFGEILQQYSMHEALHQNVMSPTNRLMSTIQSSLFQIYNGSVWGTTMVIDEEKGILLTNAHVIDSSSERPILYQKGRAIPCDVIFSCPADHPIDIAVLKTREPLEKYSQKISFSKKIVRCGDPVYAAGFPIFSKEANPDATVTKGYISHVHPHMIKTTCSVHPGASGGAILDNEGNLVAVIVCNARTSYPVNMIYPRLNMSIPANLLQPILEEYLRTEDPSVLQRLSKIDARIWNFTSKL